MVIKDRIILKSNDFSLMSSNVYAEGHLSLRHNNLVTWGQLSEFCQLFNGQNVFPDYQSILEWNEGTEEKPSILWTKILQNSAK